MSQEHCTRADMVGKLDGDYDVLVVGGGITGTGIARDAARRGLRVALIEQDDLAFGTSSRSSKLVHGGLRYLEQYEFSLVFESVSERRILMDLAPHLVNPLGFVFPVYEQDRHELWLINAGMWLYDGLSLFRSPKRHRNLRPADVEEEVPELLQDELKGAPLYFDCSTDDARLTLETGLDAAANGAVIATHCRARRLLKDARGRIGGILAEDVISGERYTVRANVVVNATGPWTDDIRRLHKEAAPELLRPTKGVHLVISRSKLPIQHAVVCLHPDDQRVLFAIPWGDRAYIGTTDTDYEGDPAEVAATADDVRYLLEACAHYFPDNPIDSDDIIATWAGLRPLIAPDAPEGMSASKVSREHQILVDPKGLVTVAGGKLTTFRRMAAEAVDDTIRLLQLLGCKPNDLRACDTAKHPLPGGVGWPKNDDHEHVASLVAEASEGSLGLESSQALANCYGMRALDIAKLCAARPSMAEPIVPGRPEVIAQIHFGVERELAARLNDVMTRRTQLFYRDVDQGLKVAHRVAEEMGGLLGWDQDRKEAEIERYRVEVGLSRGWRED